MKAIIKLLFISFLIISVAGCGSDEEYIDGSVDESELSKDLVLDKENDYFFNEEIDIQIGILEGNGGYKAVSSNEDVAKAEVEGDKVQVSFLTNGITTITVSDAKGKAARVVVSVNSHLLTPSHYKTVMKKGSITTQELFFGRGDYRVGNMRGTNVETEIVGDNLLKVKAIGMGTTTFDVFDAKGSRIDFTIWVPEYYTLTSNEMEIRTALGNLVFVTLEWGNAPWRITSAESNLFRASVTTDGTALQINVSDVNITGNDYVTLKDKDGNIANINVRVSYNN